MGDDAYIKIFAPLAFRAADKFFKFVSWALLITVIKFAQARSDSLSLLYLQRMAIFVMGGALLLQVSHIIVRDPADWNIPPHLRTVSRIFQVVVGFGLLLTITSPYLVLDTMMENLAKARP